ncbi:hypothetical protein ACXHMN_28050 [Rhizobium sp. LEGMi12c]
MFERILEKHLEPTQNITLEKNELMFRGMNVPSVDGLQADIGNNLWVYRTEVGANQYASAFDPKKRNTPVIFVYQTRRKLELAALKLGEATRELVMSNLLQGSPQIFQRDKLLPTLERMLRRNIDGFYDFPTDEILVKKGLLAHCNTRFPRSR